MIPNLGRTVPKMGTLPPPDSTSVRRIFGMKQQNSIYAGSVENVSNQDWRCDECDKDFQSKGALDMHNRDKHGIKIPRFEVDGHLTEADYQTWMRL